MIHHMTLPSMTYGLMSLTSNLMKILSWNHVSYIATGILFKVSEGFDTEQILFYPPLYYNFALLH